MNKNNIEDYSRKISERMWNLPDKGELESHREEIYIDDIIQKSHIERRLLDNLEGIDTVFDAGAGSGRFSILLAKHGCRVTHFDISQRACAHCKKTYYNKCNKPFGQFAVSC